MPVVPVIREPWHATHRTKCKPAGRHQLHQLDLHLARIIPLGKPCLEAHKVWLQAKYITELCMSSSAALKNSNTGRPCLILVQCCTAVDCGPDDKAACALESKARYGRAAHEAHACFKPKATYLSLFTIDLPPLSVNFEGVRGPFRSETDRSISIQNNGLKKQWRW